MRNFWSGYGGNYWPLASGWFSRWRDGGQALQGRFGQVQGEVFPSEASGGVIPIDKQKLYLRFVSTKFLVTTVGLAVVLIGWLCGRDASQLAVVVPATLAAYNLSNVWQSLIDQKWGGSPPSLESTPVAAAAEPVKEEKDGNDSGASTHGLSE